MWVRSYLTDLRERQNLSPNVTLLQLLGTNEEEIGKELLLNHKFDGIELPVVERINRLSLEQLEAMGESLLDFKQISDLEAWLKDAEKSNDLKPQVDIQNGNQLDV